MKNISVVIASILLLAALLTLTACDDENGIVTVRSGNASVVIDSGLRIDVAVWGGGVITISDTLEDDAIQVALPGQRTMVGSGFIWVPGGVTSSQTVLTFPITGTYENGDLLDLYWFDVANVRWIPFAGVQGVFDDGFCVVTFANGATGLGGNFAIADTAQGGTA